MDSERSGRSEHSAKRPQPMRPLAHIYSPQPCCTHLLTMQPGTVEQRQPSPRVGRVRGRSVPSRLSQ